MPVPAGITALWTRSKIAWAGMPPGQRRWSVVAAGLIAALLGTLLWMGMRTDWRTLYAVMDPDDARQMANTLTQAQIPYEVTANGTAIRVPGTYLDKARLAASAKGVRSGRLGFELFDKPNWVGSEFDEHVNYQRALEGELEHTVGTLGDVESARVHLVLSHDSLFRDQERPAKASVVL
ncbi:MAG: flagellar M-ring protein FliF, partial [Acidobacteriota bacterium]|nr:flagellar M-ring protein FliF [Acidobacteriota bacterium]